MKTYKKLRVFIWVLLFFLSLGGLRLIWSQMTSIPAHPPAVKGSLNLQNWDFAENPLVTLDGEWEFYPNQLIPFESGSAAPARMQVLQVPGSWEQAFAAEAKDSYHFGSYRLRVSLPRDTKLTFSIRLPDIRSASGVFVNGQPIHLIGRPADTGEGFIPGYHPSSVTFTADSGQADLIIHAASPSSMKAGGITGSVRFGEEGALTRTVWIGIGSQLAIALVLLIHSAYAVLLYLIGAQRKSVLTFASLGLFAAVAVLLDDGKPLAVWLNMGYETATRTILIAYTGIALCLIQLARLWFLKQTGKRIFRMLQFVYVLYTLFILFAPAYMVSRSSLFLTLSGLSTDLVFLVLMLRTVKREKEDGMFLLLGITAVVSNVFWAAIEPVTGPEPDFYPLDLLAALFALAAYWFKRYFRTSARTAELAERLQKEDKRKDDFLANTSHELRNPLHGILNMAQTVLHTEQDRLTEESRKNMELLLTVGQRMSLLLNDLLDITLLKENRVRLQPKELKIQSVAAGVADMLRYMTGGKPLELKLDIPETFPPVLADENRLTQILFNLVHNAIKFTNEGTIVIEARVGDGHAEIRIADTGIGMDGQQLVQLFQPYEQADSGITSPGGGMGLGLGICKSLVELHGGVLEASSVPGQGSVFSFTLPLAEPFRAAVYPAYPAGPDKNDPFGHDALSPAPLAAAEEELSPASPTGQAAQAVPQEQTGWPEKHPSILVVDDDPVNLTVLRNQLASEGYRVETAASGREALSLLDGNGWDLVISDVMMPLMSGYELTRTIRGRHTLAELPVLLLTARSSPQDITAGFLAGANDYVTKPLGAYDLKARVRSLIGLKLSVEERLRMEAAWLQAQIKPHFFFNTINSISILSEIDPAKMRSLLEEFSAYLQNSFDFQNSEQLIPLQRELELVRSYLAVETVRHGNRLGIHWEIDDIPGLRLPPLSIQPLVENALIHGVPDKKSGGVIRIEVKNRENGTEVRVTDNGTGMDPAILGKHQGVDAGEERRGIGLANTDRRLRHMYGTGLTLESSPGLGTAVSFFIPASCMSGDSLQPRKQQKNSVSPGRD
ncbi:ATP-binding protein [Paenibacillus chitinolyticus]|uniref:ATP-binding protein n=1 Tax=Paenibacillus chitinolyticus TaxID=79263 RepID=UPI001C478AE5|nr:ATP-binding protein [Paenibacillus chitinolyticus]MBV6713312.1 response regulator [Paenibacillus chitinolyticus]